MTVPLEVNVPPVAFQSPEQVTWLAPMVNVPAMYKLRVTLTVPPGVKVLPDLITRSVAEFRLRLLLLTEYRISHEES